MKYVYVVNQNLFDDHIECHYTTVHAVFASEQAAKQYIATLPAVVQTRQSFGDFYDISEFPLFETPHRLSAQEIRDIDYDKALAAIADV